ncbi:MAG: hypothetical protein QF492_01315 [Candidatus Krumholzibacteria bacterium]|nr:hypothetical protein [Candidatus Krumholzibacteria bacterium]MDP6668531.1 hypothetical protein [Candidatus Krumholzibacteria bacterium]MDP6797795.1 hypothetical protein [Candidatus Krumholzibacteria bacterium]MDP7021412.1 hypothetical protein [Candidatus Krumholzibacteria bacterium]
MRFRPFLWILCLALPALAIEETMVFSSPEADGAPCWNASGDSIAFSSLQSGNWEIYRIASGGGEAENLSQHEDTDIYVHWSPAGSSLVFTSSRDGGDMDLWIMDSPGAEARILTLWEGYDNFAAFDPMGTRIAFSSDRDGDIEIWLLETEEPDAAVKLSDGLVDCLHPSWSSDGQWIAFDAQDPDNPDQRRLYRMPLSGGPAEAIEHGLDFGIDPSFSPDGQYLVFCGGNDLLEWDLWAWDFEEESLVQLTDNRFSDQSPVWSAEGESIVFARVSHGNKDVWTISDLPIQTPVRRTNWGSFKAAF